MCVVGCSSLVLVAVVFSIGVGKFIYQMKCSRSSQLKASLFPLGGLVPVAADLDLALVCSAPSALSIPILLALALIASGSVGLCT